MKRWTIVGYSYAADIYCTSCIEQVVRVSEVEDNDACDFAGEAWLDHVAAMRGIDREKPTSFDSGEFPKIVRRDMLEGVEWCGNCHCELEDV